MKTRRFWRILSVVILVLAVVAVTALGPVSTQAARKGSISPTAQPVLCQVTSPNPGQVNVLNGVSAVRDADPKLNKYVVWAVGYIESPSWIGPSIRTLTMRNAGKGWEVVPSANLKEATHNYLTAVTAVTPNDVWAVGYAVVKGMEKPLVMHFDGSTWNLVSTRTAFPAFGRLTSVTVLPNSDIAVVAGYEQWHLPTSTPFVLYYAGGTSWKNINFPNDRLDSAVYGITGKSLNDLWAAVTVGTTDQEHTMGFLYHFDGKSWTMSSKAPGSLVSVAVVGNNVFAVGHQDADNKAETMGMMYDIAKGETVRIKTFNRDMDHNFLTAVIADGSNVYAIGYTGVQENDVTLNTLVLQYQDGQFNAIESPSPTGIDRLMGATMVNGHLWAVGDSQKGANKTLILSTICND